MSTLIRGKAVAADPYLPVADDAALPAGPALITLARWTLESAALAEHVDRLAVRLPNTTNVMALDKALLGVATLVLEFPGFADGRAYSQAHLLRERLAYRGEIRATGAAVVRDQILGMARCGIDSFELRADQSADACLQALHEFSRAYQPGVSSDAVPSVRRLRRA